MENLTEKSVRHCVQNEKEIHKVHTNEGLFFHLLLRAGSHALNTPG
jgi:hypothetical protein